MLHSTPPLEAGPLLGRGVRLLPLRADHVDALVRAAGESRESYAHSLVPDTADAMRRYVEVALAAAGAGLAIPFATFDVRAGRIVGSTRFASLEHALLPVEGVRDVAPSSVEIGWTWLSASAQRTHVNTEAKLLMLAHAFEAWQLPRVMLKTSELNSRSRAAIERIGGRFDGIARTYLPGGNERQSAFYSLLARDWPANKARLLARLERA